MKTLSWIWHKIFHSDFSYNFVSHVLQVFSGPEYVFLSLFLCSWAMLEFIGLKRRYTDGQQTHEKMLIITYHQGNANKNYNEMSPHTCQNGLNQQYKKRQVLVKMWKKRNPCSLLMGMQTGAVNMENSMEVPQKVKDKTL